MNWSGVIPAITTPFREDLSVDHHFLAKHASWMIDSGCNGIVALGSLGEGATLEFDDKVGVFARLQARLRFPGVAASFARTIQPGVRLVEKNEESGWLSPRVLYSIM